MIKQKLGNDEERVLLEGGIALLLAGSNERRLLELVAQVPVQFRTRD